MLHSRLCTNPVQQSMSIRLRVNDWCPCMLVCVCTRKHTQLGTLLSGLKGLKKQGYCSLKALSSHEGCTGPSSQGHSRGLSNSFQKFRSHKEGWLNRSLLMHLAGIIPRVPGVTQSGHKATYWWIKNRLLEHVNGCILVTFSTIWPLPRSAWTEFWPIKCSEGQHCSVTSKNVPGHSEGSSAKLSERERLCITLPSCSKWPRDQSAYLFHPHHYRCLQVSSTSRKDGAPVHTHRVPSLCPALTPLPLH